MKPRKQLVSIVAVLVVLVIAGLFWHIKWRAQPTNVVRIGYLPIYVDLPLFVAQKQGFFQKRGVQVELVRFSSSPDIGTALITGGVSFGASTAFSVVLTTESRDPGKLKIFIVDSETKDNYLDSFVVLKNSGIKSIADLRGKRLAVFPGPTAITFCKMVLEKFGINADRDLQFIVLDSASHLSALKTHTVDALFTYEPIATQAVLEDDAVKILPGAVEQEIITPWQAGVWVVSRQFAAQDPAKARAVMLALYDAIDFIRANPQAAKAALTNFTSIKPDVAIATPNIPFAKLGEVDIAALQKHADILTQQGVISKQINVTTLLVSTDSLSARPN